MILHRGITASPVPRGIAFDIADLILAQGWADGHDFRMAVHLDHGSAVNEDYEEVVAFQTQTSPLYRVILWRNADTVCVQPLVGRARRYASVAAALESLLPARDITPTDIVAKTWPIDPA